jgi:hypothetical protein
MAAKEHEEWNKKKKEISSGGVLGVDYDHFINWGKAYSIDKAEQLPQGLL